MTTYPISLPVQVGDSAVKLQLGMNDITYANVSPYNRKGNYLEWDTGWWTLTITIPPVGRDFGQKWLSFLAKLKGRAGTFQTAIPGHDIPLGSCAEEPGFPRVNGADQTGDSILCDGMPASRYRYLAEGDFIQIGTRLYVVTEDMNTTADGAGRMHVWPKIDGEHGDNVRVIVSGAMGLFRLTGDQRSLGLSSYDVYDTVISAEEVR